MLGIHRSGDNRWAQSSHWVVRLDYLSGTRKGAAVLVDGVQAAAMMELILFDLGLR